MDAGSSNSPAGATGPSTLGQRNPGATTEGLRVKKDADYIFHELTRSICPQCKAGH